MCIPICKVPPISSEMQSSALLTVVTSLSQTLEKMARFD